MKKFLMPFVIVAIVFFNGCAKSGTNPPATSSRTTNMYGQAIPTTFCKVTALSDSANKLVGQTLNYNKNGTLDYLSNGSSTTSFTYDSLNRLIKIVDYIFNPTGVRYTINYTGTSSQATSIDYYDIRTATSNGSVQITYPSRNSVVFKSSSSTTSAMAMDTILFDGNNNPIYIARQFITNTGAKELYSTTNTTFSTITINPYYPTAFCEFNLLSFLGPTYDRSAFLCGKNIGMLETHANTDFTRPLPVRTDRDTITVYALGNNSNNYPKYLGVKASSSSGTKTTISMDYKCD